MLFMIIETHIEKNIDGIADTTDVFCLYKMQIKGGFQHRFLPRKNEVDYLIIA